jgi:bifunctional non-homologous end joining protein LigD
MATRFPARALKAPLPDRVHLQIVSSAAEPPAGDGWLHEIKHDGHRLVAVVDGKGVLRLLSRNGYDRSKLFRAPFHDIAALGCELVLDGEIAVPDERGATHIGDLQDDIAQGRSDRLAYFAFDVLHLDGHDLRGCPIEERKALLERVIKAAASPRLVSVSHVVGRGAWLFEAMQKAGCEGIVSKRLGSPYRGGQSKDWLKVKVSETGVFVVTGFKELGPNRLEAIRLAEKQSGALLAAGEVRFGFTGKRLWSVLDPLRAGEAGRDGVVPVKPELWLSVKYFGRHKGGAIRDGVVLAIDGG